MPVPLRILIVEDSASDAELALLELGRGRLAPKWRRVESADEMHAALADGAWDAVLSDYSLPGFGAEEALAICRATDPDLPFVVVSGTIGERQAVEMMRAGAGDYLLKGNLTRLSAAVEREVQAAEGRRARRKAEHATAQLAAIVESSDDAIFSETLDGIITSWNPAAVRLTGWAPAEAVGRHFSFLVPPDYAEELSGVMRRLMRGEQVEPFETVRVRKDGTRIDVSVTLSPIRDGDGRLIGVSKIVRDISGRKRAEAAARVGEARFRAVVESDMLATFFWEEEGRVTEANDAFLSLVGYTRDDLQAGRVSWVDLTPPECRTRDMNALAEIARTGRCTPFEKEYVRKDGGRVSIMLGAAAVNGGSGVAFAFDLTERKRAEARQAWDALLLANVRDAIVVTDPDGIATGWNDGAERLFGWTAAEMVGRPLTDRVPEGDRERMAEATRSILQGAEFAGEWEDWRKDGSRLWIDARVGRITDPTGRVIGVLGVSHDITDRKRAEAAVKATEERLRQFVEHVSAPIAMLDRDMRYLHVSRRWLTDYRLGERDLTGLSHYEVFPDAPEHWKEIHRRCLAGATDRCDEARFERADGTVQWIRWDVRPWLQDRGEVGGIIMFTEDITERKRSHEAVRASEERYRTLIAATTAVVWDSPASGEFDSDQPSWTAFTGQTLEQHRGWGWLNVIHPDDRQKSARAWAAAVAHREEYRMEHRLRRADGEYRDMSARAVPVLDAGGAIREWVGVHTDVTERTRAEAAVQESEERYRRLADAMPQIVWVTRPNGYHEFYNRQWYDYTGLTFGETGGDGWNNVFHPDDQPLAWERWQHALATGDTYEIEYRCRRHDGEYRWFLGRALPQRDSEGQIVRWFGTCTDIHDFKRAAAERAELLGRLNLQVERMPLAYLLSDADGRYTRWNPAAERLFGFTEAEVLGKRPFDVTVPPQSRPVVAEIFARLAAGDMDAHGVVENVTRDGRTITCEWYNTPLFNTDGTFQGVLSLAQDVTARRLAENELHLRDRAIQAVTGGLLITDASRPDHPIIYTSPGFERLTGYTAGEVVGRNCRFLQGADTDPEAVKRLREAIRDATPCDVELINYRKDGTPFWNGLSISPVCDSARRVTHFVGVQQDVTERKRTEATLRDREELLRNVIAHIPAGVFWKDRDGRFLGANDRFAQDQGFPAPDAVVGKTDLDLPVARAEVEAFRAADLRIMALGEPVLNVAETQTRSDGRKVHLLVSKVPLRDTTGQVSGVLGVYQDVTEHHRLEEQFRQAQKMEAFGQLAGGVAHDFNNLLTVINGYSEVMLGSLRPDDRNRGLVDEILKAGERATLLTRQLLAFSRKQVVQPQVLDLNGVIANTEKMLGRLIGEDVTLTTALAPDLGRVNADAGQVEQVIMNLVVNARDAMPRGGRITIATANIDLGADDGHPHVAPGRWVLLEVRDTGCGMTDEVKRQIFEPFFTTKEVGKGTGLGLATVFGIVNQSGGHVEVFSEVGIGTAFKVYLPRVEQPAPLSKSRSTINLTPRGTETVLMVEDDDGVRFLTRHMLKSFGYTVLEAAGGVDALRIAGTHAGPIQLLLTDVVMPGMSGRQVAEGMAGLHPETKVLFVSGYTDDAVVRHGILQDAVHFLPKPFSPVALACKVREVLDPQAPACA